MTARQYQIRQCTSSVCQFRFPAPAGFAKAETCPKCGSPTAVVLLSTQESSWNPRHDTPSGPPVEAFLDNIRSSFNVGAMFRTSDGAGLTHLHLVGTTPTPDHAGVAKTALGAEFSIPWTYYLNGVEAAQSLKAQGKQLWALEVGPQSVPLFESLPQPDDSPVVLVVGNEVSGVDPGIQALCDRFIWIPMQGFKRSLNVAIAFGIAVYFLRYGQAIHK